MSEASISMRGRPFTAAKRGNTLAENKDRHARNTRKRCFAIADGATESSRAGEWAQLLVEKFVQEPVQQVEHWSDWLLPLQKQWRLQTANSTSSWFAEVKSQEGAFATLLGIEMRTRSHQWQAVAVGDSCLFQIRDGRLHRAFPIEQAEQFDNRPDLIGSHTPPAEIRERGKERRITGDWQHGDYFLLMTDALAEWFLRSCRGCELAETLAQIVLWKNDQEFNDWVEHLRDTRELRNDDVTLLYFQIRNALAAAEIISADE